MMTADTQLRERVIEIAADYLGPAAPRFIDRIITNHLQKSPDALIENDLPELIEWAKLATAVLTDDTSEIEHFTARLQQLV